MKKIFKNVLPRQGQKCVYIYRGFTMRRFQSRQFTIKSLLILMLVVASCFGWIRWTLAKLEKRWTNEQQVLVKLRGYKAELKTEPQAPEWLKRIVTKETAEIFDSITEIRVLSQPVDESTVQQIGQLENLRVLALNHCDIPDAWLVHLEGLRTLQWLELVNNRRITDEGLVHLRNLTELRTLALWLTSVCGTELSHLRSMSHLEALVIRNPHLVPIAECKIPVDLFVNLNRLTVLKLDNLRFPDGEINGLAHLHALKILSLEHANLDESVWTTIGNLPALETAMLDYSNIDDAGIRQLSQSLSIKNLYLNKTDVSDRCLEDLGKMQSLETLGVDRQRITRDRLKQFTESNIRIDIY